MLKISEHLTYLPRVTTLTKSKRESRIHKRKEEDDDEEET